VACAFALPCDDLLPELRDSKKLSDTKRRVIYEKLLRLYPNNFTVRYLFSEDIDAMGIEKCNQRVIEWSIEDLCPRVQFHKVVVDGLFCPVSYGISLVRADAIVPAVMAASIVAKVTRDAYMLDAHKYLDKWGFSNNKGYGTSDHIEAIRLHGITNEHRRSFEPVKSLCLGINKH
jgi:ribonuclease HII